VESGVEPVLPELLAEVAGVPVADGAGVVSEPEPPELEYCCAACPPCWVYGDPWVYVVVPVPVEDEGDATGGSYRDVPEDGRQRSSSGSRNRRDAPLLRRRP
jgi:hypothetical protein